MKLTPQIQKAIDKAAYLHTSIGQERKSEPGMPYIVHPFAVAWMLVEYTNDEDVVCAGLLHDILEDVPGYSADDMEKDFGQRITEIVKELTEEKSPTDSKEKKKASWKERKDKYLAHLEKASKEALLIACVDKTHNLQSLVRDYKEIGEEAAKGFAIHPKESLWFYEEVLRIASAGIENPSPAKALEEILKEARAVVE